MNAANSLPDESLLVLPDEWQSDLLPRRGVRPGEPFEIDPEAPAYWRKRLAKQEAALRTALAAYPNPDALAYLDGEPNALGAGLIAEMAAVESPTRNDSKLHPMLDAWIEEHGLPFAVAAAVAFMSYESPRGTAFSRSSSLIEYDQRRVSERPLTSMSGVLHLTGDLRALRGLLAEAAEPEFEAAASAVGLMRNSPARKYFAALFFPDRTDWVDEAAVEVAKVTWRGLLTARLAHSVSSREQLTTMGVRSIDPHEQHTGLLTPLVDSLGVAVLPLSGSRGSSWPTGSCPTSGSAATASSSSTTGRGSSRSPSTSSCGRTSPMTTASRASLCRSPARRTTPNSRAPRTSGSRISRRSCGPSPSTRSAASKPR